MITQLSAHPHLYHLIAWFEKRRITRATVSNQGDFESTGAQEKTSSNNNSYWWFAAVAKG